MYREIIVACFEIHMDHVHLLYEHNIEFWNVTPGGK